MIAVRSVRTVALGLTARRFLTRLRRVAGAPRSSAREYAKRPDDPLPPVPIGSAPALLPFRARAPARAAAALTPSPEGHRAAVPSGASSAQPAARPRATGAPSIRG